jgi:hypothetical protein
LDPARDSPAREVRTTTIFECGRNNVLKPQAPRRRAQFSLCTGAGGPFQAKRVIMSTYEVRLYRADETLSIVLKSEADSLSEMESATWAMLKGDIAHAEIWAEKRK